MTGKSTTTMSEMGQLGQLLSKPFYKPSLIIGLIGLFILVSVHFTSLLLLMVWAAILLGYVEVENACGLSHVVAINDLRQTEETSVYRAKAALSYTIAGCVTAGIVGLVVGAMGNALVSDNIISLIGYIGIFLCTLLILRELEIFPFNIPQIHRQTQKWWAGEYGIVEGAGMWGAHIGIGFATVMAHGGLYVLTIVALVEGPLIGSLVLMAFWLGRTLPIHLAVIEVPKESCEEIIFLVREPRNLYKFVAIVGFVASSYVFLQYIV